MATAEKESGKPDTDSIAAIAVNRANTPREWKIRGSWKRWEPAGREGDSVGLTKAELDSGDFASVAKYFAIKAVTK